MRACWLVCWSAKSGCLTSSTIAACGGEKLKSPELPHMLHGHWAMGPEKLVSLKYLINSTNYFTYAMAFDLTYAQHVAAHSHNYNWELILTNMS